MTQAAVQNISTHDLAVRVKKLTPEAVVPSYAKIGDAGMDLVATSVQDDASKPYIQYGTGLAFEIPLGYVGLVFPRSSVSKTDLSLANAVGVIDSGYRGEVMLRFRRGQAAGVEAPIYEVGDRVGQIMILPHPQVQLVEAQELSETVRGAGGFGSSGQ